MPAMSKREVRGRAHVAALGHHGVQPRRSERGELLQRGQDEGSVRIDAAGPQRRGVHRRAVAAEHAPHGVAVHMQLPRDGAHAPLLHRVQAQDLRHQVRGYGHGAAWTAPTSPPRPVGRGAGSPGAPGLAVTYRNGGSTSTPVQRSAAARSPRRGCADRLKRCRASMPPVEQRPPPAGNPGASRYVRRRPCRQRQHGVGASAVTAAREPCARATSAGNAARSGAAHLHGPGAGTPGRSNGCRGHSGCTERPGCDSAHTGTAGRVCP